MGRYLVAIIKDGDMSMIGTDLDDDQIMTGVYEGEEPIQGDMIEIRYRDENGNPLEAIGPIVEIFEEDYRGDYTL